MSHCNLSLTEEVQVFFKIVSIPTFIFGFLGNVAVFVALLCRRREGWNYMMIYIVNLAFADSCVLFSLPFKMYSYFTTWDLSSNACLVLVSFYFVNMYVSIFTVTAISVVRYVGIIYPFKAREIMSSEKALVVCVLIWLTIVSLSACFHFVDAPNNNATEIRCFQKITSKPLPIPFIVVLEIAGFFLPLLTMAFCSIQIIKSLSKQSDVSSSSDKSQCIRIIAANLIVFVVCFLPFHVAFLWKFLVEKYTPDKCELLNNVHNFVHVSMLIANTNCCLDTFSYYFYTRDFWKTVCISKSRTSRNVVI